MFSVKKYEIDDKIVWDEFVKNAKNGHFFFYRDFMEYHSDRFADNSLLIYKESTLVALLPSNLNENVLYTHQGLTFGGLITKSSNKQSQVNSIFDAIVDYAKVNKFSKIVYKRLPHIYHIIPSDEDLYAMFLHDFDLIRRDVSSSINLSNQITYSKGRKWLVKKAKQSNLSVECEVDTQIFWGILSNVLYEKHNVKPTHSVTEIEYLLKKFPKNIKLFTCESEGEILSGAVIFDTQEVAHAQYLFNTERGRELGALDLLIDYLVKDVFAKSRFFDFGISNEQQGKFLNEGLISQKEGFGARAICHEFYEKKL